MFAAEDDAFVLYAGCRVRPELVLAAARLPEGLFGWDLELQSCAFLRGLSRARLPRVGASINDKMTW